MWFLPVAVQNFLLFVRNLGPLSWTLKFVSSPLTTWVSLRNLVLLLFCEILHLHLILVTIRFCRACRCLVNHFSAGDQASSSSKAGKWPGNYFSLEYMNDISIVVVSFLPSFSCWHSENKSSVSACLIWFTNNAFIGCFPPPLNLNSLPTSFSSLADVWKRFQSCCLGISLWTVCTGRSLFSLWGHHSCNHLLLVPVLCFPWVISNTCQAVWWACLTLSALSASTAFFWFSIFLSKA